MKLTTLFLVALYLHLGATGFGQKVTISGKNLPLEKVFTMIKKQTGYVFFYDYNIFQETKPVTLNLKEADIEDAMRVCLWGQDLDFNITNKTISVVKKERRINLISADPEKTIKASGTIFNESGQPLSAATVTVKETKRGTLTNVKGQFEISAVPVNAVLTITCIGYASRQVKVNSEELIVVYLPIAVNELDKAVVQAYGTTSQRLATGNIAKVTASEIERQPVMNPLIALQGKVAGLDVNQTSGFASAPIKVELRGRKSIGIDPSHTFPSDPLYIIDGVPLTVLEVGGSSSYDDGSTGFIQNQNGFNGPASGQSPFFSINPADIESIEVLKDADATSIYGSRGANGVILITTKKGKIGKTKFSLHTQQGVSKVSRFVNLLNTQQYIEMRREAFENNGINPNAKNAYDLLSWDTLRYTNWQKMLYGKTGKTVDLQGDISGGDAHTTFRVGVDYNKTQNIQTVSGSDQRASISVNLTNHSTNQKFTISFSSAFSFAQSNMVYQPGNITLAPNAPGIYDSVGKLNFAGWGGSNNNINGRKTFPFGTLEQQYIAKTNFLNSSLSFSYQPIKGLNLTASFGYNNAQANQQNYIPISSQDPIFNPTGKLNLGFNSNKNWIIEPQLTYERWLSKGKLSILLGNTLQYNSTDGLYVNGDGYTNDALIKTITNAPVQYNTDSYGQYKYAGVFSRLNYNWSNKYIINLSARRDGSSKFGVDRQFGNFASIGAAWILSEETWFKSLSFITFAKLRGSYGSTGSDAVGDYQYLTRWSSSGTIPYNGISQLVPIQHANPNFQWQSNKQIEAAVDLDFFKDIVHLSVAYYRNRIGNQLISFPIPAYTGFSSVTANSPALVQNEGWEFTTRFKIIESKNFKWALNFNTAFNNNKLVDYPNFSLSPFVGQLIIGKPLNIRRLLHYTGVDSQSGEYAFYDKDHDGQITYDYTGTKPDDSYIYNLNPKFFGGLGTDFNYKSLSISLYFAFKKQIGRNSVYQGDIPGKLKNQPVDVLARWQKPGDISSIARFTTAAATSDNNYKTISDGSYTDASYIRLSNVSLSYTLPPYYLNKIGLQGLSLFIHVNNIFVLTKYKGVDPETQNFGGLPPTKTVVGGIAMSF